MNLRHFTQMRQLIVNQTLAGLSTFEQFSTSSYFAEGPIPSYLLTGGVENFRLIVENLTNRLSCISSNTFPLLSTLEWGKYFDPEIYVLILKAFSLLLSRFGSNSANRRGG